MTTAIMSSSTLTLADKLQQTYNGVLLQISFNLNRKHQEQLSFYFKGLIPIDVTDTINMLRSLEHNSKISWQDVNLVKDGMHHIGRSDIATKLTEYEIKRDLTLLLDFYARKTLGLELCCSSVAVKKVAGHLVRLMEIVRDRIDIKTICSTVESSKDIRKALVEFQEEIDCGEMDFSWTEFTKLVVIAGEIIAFASTNEENLEQPVIELCCTAADELCSRMTELGSWEDFCAQVKERYNLIHRPRSMDSNLRLSLQKQRAQLLQQLTDAIFFPV